MTSDLACSEERLIASISSPARADTFTSALAVWAGADFAVATGEEADIDAAVGSAGHVLAHATRMWEQATLQQKLRPQRAPFRDGVSLDDSAGGTAVTRLAFAQLPAFGGAEVGLASPTGFEAETPSEPPSQTVDQTRKDDELGEERDDGKRRR